MKAIREAFLEEQRVILVERPAEHVLLERKRHGSLLRVGVGRPGITHDMKHVRLRQLAQNFIRIHSDNGTVADIH